MRKSTVLSSVAVLLWLLLGPASPLVGLAYGDKVDDLVKQLKDSDYKVRLSAALNLGRIGSKKAIPPLIDSLKDPEKTIRGVVCAALSKLVDGTVEAPLRDRAISELQRVAKEDSDGFVRQQAQKAYDVLKPLASAGGGGGGAAGGKKVYVEVGPMADASKQGGAPVIAIMRSTVETTIAKKNPSFMTKWPSGASPSKAQLTKGGATAAFFVDGTLTTMDVKKTGSLAEVSCNVSLFIATYPEKSMFGFLKGGAQVQTGATDKAIAEGKSDCVSAVLEDIVGRQVVPTIQQRVP